MTQKYSSAELARRYQIRNLFKEIDGAALVGISKNLPLSVYSIPLLPTDSGSVSYLEFGPAFDHAFSRSEIDDEQRIILWCKSADTERIVELAHCCGFTPVQVSGADGLGYLDFSQDAGNTQISMLATEMMKALIDAFDITQQDQALIDETALKNDNEILPGLNGPPNFPL